MSTLLDEVQQRVADERQQTALEYRAILLRSDDPEEGDADGLRACMTVLSIGAAELQRDLETVKKIAAIEREIERWTPAEEAAHTRALSAVASFVQETEEILRERKVKEVDLRVAYQGLENRRAAVTRAKEELAALRRRRPIVFGEVPPEPAPPPPMRIGPLPDATPVKTLGPNKIVVGI